MKKIFITMFQGVESKNILRTGIIDKLLTIDLNLHVILFVKNEERKSYYQKEFDHPRISYEIADPQPPRGLDKLFSDLKFHFLRTETTRLRAEIVAQDRWPFYYYFKLALHWLLARKYFARIFRFLDWHLVTDNYFDMYFEKHKPDLILLADLFEDFEASFLRSAKKYGVYSIGYINSWDRMTNRAILRILPDKFIVWNDLVKRATIETNYVDERDIFVSGIPQYDRYFQSIKVSREGFCKKLGIEPSNKIVVYSPLGNKFSDSDWDIIDLLYKLNDEKRFGDGVSILVRFPPNDFVEKAELEKRPQLLYQYPGVRFSNKRTIDWDMTTSELEDLRDTLYHMDLIICYASSISVDVAVFDKPVINIDFEIKPVRKLERSAITWKRLGHYAQAIKMGGIRLVKDEDELIEWVKRYLHNPALDKEGRKNLAEKQLQFMDGGSAERIATFTATFLHV